MQRRLIFALAPVALAAAGVAFAQPSGPGPEVRMMRHGGPPPEEMKARHEAMMKQHAEDLRVLLRLRPDQEAALTAFLASHEPRMERRMMPDDRPMTTPQRLEEMAKREEAMRAAQARRREALARFYAALSADQQKAFDALQRLRSHGGPGHGPMMGARHGMMMHGGPVERRVIIRKDGPDAPHGH